MTEFAQRRAGFLSAIIEGGDKLALVRKEIKASACDDQPRCAHFNAVLPAEAQGWCEKCIRRFALEKWEAHLESEDSATRLILADWLEEQGDAGSVARAEIIRNGCERPAVTWTCEGDADVGLVCSESFRCPTCQAALASGCPDRFLGEGSPGKPRYLIRRGFVEEVTCGAATFLRHADALRTSTPLRRVVLTTRPEWAHDEYYEMWWLVGDGTKFTREDDLYRERDAGGGTVTAVLLRLRFPAIEFELPEAS